MDSRGFRCHNSRPAGPIEMSSKNGLMRQSRGTIHTLDAKNRITRDIKLGIKKLTTQKGPVLYHV
jgi:hypothetical protein